MKRFLEVEEEEEKVELEPEILLLIHDYFCLLVREDYVEKFGSNTLHRKCPEPTFMTTHIICLKNHSYREYMNSSQTGAKNKKTGQYEYQGEDGREKHSYFCNLMRKRIERDKYKRPIVGQEISGYIRWSTSLWLWRQFLLNQDKT